MAAAGFGNALNDGPRSPELLKVRKGTWIDLFSLSSDIGELASGDITDVPEPTIDLFEVYYGNPDVYSSPAALLDFCLLRTGMLQCKDPRDRVSAFLCILKPGAAFRGNPLGIGADYAKSVVDVYTETMAYILINSETLTPLSGVRHQLNPTISGLPSWVADLTFPRTASFLHSQLGSADVDPYNASRDCIVGFAVEDRLLKFHLYRYANVTHVGEPWGDSVHRNLFEKTAQMVLARFETNFKKDLLIDDVWKTMLCDLMFFQGKIEEADVRSQFSTRLMLMSRKFVYQQLEMGNGSQVLSEMQWQARLAEVDDTGTIPSPEVAIAAQESAGDPDDDPLFAMLPSKFDYAVSNLMRDRKLFLLDTGEMGYGGYDVEPGDTCCIIADGGRTPSILRKVDGESGNNWRFIGEAYVRGIMYGEAVDQMEGEGKTWEKGCMI